MEIMSSFGKNKETGINNILIKILKLDLLNTSAPSITYLLKQVFFLTVKKVTSVYKKGSKLECEYYKPISMLSNLHKIIKKLIKY